MLKLINILVTLGVLLLINFGITKAFDYQFIDFSFAIGLLGAFVIKFFNSSGGYSSRSLDLKIQSQTGIKQEANNSKFKPSTSFYTAIFYAIVALIVTFFYYREYFIG